MSRRLVLLTLLILGLGAMVLSTGANRLAAAETAAQVASFDYSMPDRFGRDDNLDGIVDYYVPTTHCDSANGPCHDVPATSPLPVAPSTWIVNLNACASEVGLSGQVSYSWRDVDDVGITFAGGPGCSQYSATVPQLATYRIELTATGPNGTASTIQEVVVKDLLIVSMGDSYGSGEGNPERDQVFTIDSVVPPSFTYIEAAWQDRRCHRSSLAGSAQAALEIERADPHTSVTFIHTACSGANLIKDPSKPANDWSTGGILDKYYGTDTSLEAQAANNGVIPPLEPQVDQVKNLIGSRKIDALYISIGGNDANFGPIVISCLALEPCNPVAQGLPDWIIPDAGLVLAACAPVWLLVPPPIDAFAYGGCVIGLGYLVGSFAGATAEHRFTDGFYGEGANPANPDTWRITGLYGQLQERLFGPNGIMHGRDTHSLFLSEYVDATRNDDGSYCPSAIWDVARNLRVPGISEHEWHWLDTTVEQTLSSAIQYNTSTRGWTFVDGIYNAFRNHGACAEDAWFVGLVPETFLRQGNMSGAAHPNYLGHRAYRNRILERWLPYLYPGAGTPGIPGNLMGSPASYVQAWVAAHPVRRPPQMPIVRPGGPYSVVEGSTVTASNTTWDGDHDDLAYEWYSGNTEIATVSPWQAASPTIAGVDDGTTDLSLKVTDDDGMTSVTTPVTVTNANPVATITTAGNPTGFTLPLVALPISASFTDAGAMDTHTATVDWGDGTPAVIATVTESSGSGSLEVEPHAYMTAGAKTITVRVTDDDGGIGTTTKTITVLTGAQAAQAILDNLKGIAADTGQTAAVRDAAAKAVVLLEGLRSGLANNGALDKLSDGDDAAALLKLRGVVAALLAVPEESRPPAMSLAAYVLAQIADSVASQHYGAAIEALASPTPAQQAELTAIAQLLTDGRQAVAGGNLLGAIDYFMEVLRRSDGLLK